MTLTVGLTHYLLLAACLFSIGMGGVLLHSRNFIIMMISIELMLLAVILNFVAFSQLLGNAFGYIFALIVLGVAAAETAIGLAILMVYFRNREDISVDSMSELKG